MTFLTLYLTPKQWAPACFWLLEIFIKKEKEIQTSIASQASRVSYKNVSLSGIEHWSPMQKL